MVYSIIPLNKFPCICLIIDGKLQTGASCSNFSDIVN